MINQSSAKKVVYSVEDYPQVASDTALQLGALWQDTYYDMPQSLGDGMIEAYQLTNASVMIAIFNLIRDLTVQRTPSINEPKLLVDIIVSGFSPLSFEKEKEVKRLGFNMYLSTNRVNVSAQITANMQHEQICIAMDKKFVKNHLPSTFLGLIEGDFFKPIKIPTDLDSMISSLLISQNEQSRLSTINQNLSHLLERIVSILKNEEKVLVNEILERK